MKVKLIELRSSKNVFSEFIKVENFSNKEECLKIINEYYKIDYYFLENNDVKKCEVIYLLGDGGMYFYENLEDSLEWLKYDEKYSVEIN
jgi:hypothetical protein